MISDDVIEAVANAISEVALREGQETGDVSSEKLARAAIEAYQAAVGDGWQPIETAPDGEFFAIMWFQLPARGHAEAQEFIWVGPVGDDCDGHRASHWIPLPEPPLVPMRTGRRKP